MRADIKSEWLAALRSGKYKQATGVLHDPASGGYCCLGVLCEIARKHGIVDLRIDDQGAFYGHSMHLPPYAVQEWAELPERNPEVPFSACGCGCSRNTVLSEINDNGNMNFSQIADLIEKHL